MEKRFLDQIKRRTWRSPFSEGLPSRWAGSCTQRQYRKIYWAVKDGLIYLNENNKKKWRPFEADLSLWGHYMWMEQWQLPHKFYRTARHHASPGTDCSKSPGCLCVPPCYIYFLRREALPSHEPRSCAGTEQHPQGTGFPPDRRNTSAVWRELPQSHSPHHLTVAKRAAEAFNTSLNGCLWDTNHRGLKRDRIRTSAVSRALWCHLSMACLKLEEIVHNITWSWATLFLSR